MIKADLDTRVIDSVYDVDERFKAAEADENLVFIPELSGTRLIGVAIVGCGRMGSIHLYNAMREPRAQVHYVLDIDKKRLEFFRKKYFFEDRGIKCLTPDQFDTILNDKKVEALLIATPTFTHEQYIKLGLDHNKHILVEKPMAEKIETVEALTALAIEKKLILSCAFQRRIDPSYRRVRDQAMRGEVGKIRLIKTCARDSPGPPMEYIRTSGGVFHDCYVHDCDLILWIAQELPIEVYAIGHSHDEEYRKLDDYDSVAVTMKFGSGLMSQSDMSRHSPSYEQRIEVHGPSGQLKLDEMSPLGWERHNKMGLTRSSNCFSFASRYSEAYARELTELFNHIEGLSTLEPIDNLKLVTLCKIITAVENSARIGQVVKIDWSEEELKRKY